jgi:hypothetical protein
VRTVRGGFSGTLKKKLGLSLASANEDRGRVYRIAEPAVHVKRQPIGPRATITIWYNDPIRSAPGFRSMPIGNPAGRPFSEQFRIIRANWPSLHLGGKAGSVDQGMWAATGFAGLRVGTGFDLSKDAVCRDSASLSHWPSLSRSAGAPGRRSFPQP